MSKKLLLADDSITIQKVIQITFAHEDYDLTITDNGDAALAKAQELKPDLVMADVYMPGKNGYELTAAIRQDPDLQNTPVLLLAGSFEPFDEEKARNCRANAWIEKPFESQNLIDKVSELLNSSPPSASGTQTVAVPESAPQGSTLADFDQPPTAEPEAAEVSEDAFGDISFAEETPAFAPEPTQQSMTGVMSLQNRRLSRLQSKRPMLWTIKPPKMSRKISVLRSMSPLQSKSRSRWLKEPTWMPSTRPRKKSCRSMKAISSMRKTSNLSPRSRRLPHGPVTQPPMKRSLLLKKQFSSRNRPTLQLSQRFRMHRYLRRRSQRLPPAVAEPALEPAPVAEAPPAEEEPEHVAVATAVVDVEEKASALSEDEIEQVIEKVVTKVVEKLAGTILERVAWEVVPDLAEHLIREEIRKIKEAAA